MTNSRAPETRCASVSGDKTCSRTAGHGGFHQYGYLSWSVADDALSDPPVGKDPIETVGKDVSVICRDCGTLLGGPEAGNAVFWTICGCKNSNPENSQFVGGRWIAARALTVIWKPSLWERIVEAFR